MAAHLRPHSYKRNKSKCPEPWLFHRSSFLRDSHQAGSKHRWYQQAKLYFSPLQLRLCAVTLSICWRLGRLPNPVAEGLLSSVCFFSVCVCVRVCGQPEPHWCEMYVLLLCLTLSPSFVNTVIHQAPAPHLSKQMKKVYVLIICSHLRERRNNNLSLMYSCPLLLLLLLLLLFILSSPLTYG